MRVLLLALMIALLPLRGWAGDAMAVEMAPGHCLTMKNIALNSYATGARGQFDADCESAHTGVPGPAVTVADGSKHDAAPPDATTRGQCSNSSVCLTHQTAAVMTSVPVQPPAAPVSLLWPASGVWFASVSLAPSMKPPIS